MKKFIKIITGVLCALILLVALCCVGVRIYFKAPVSAYYKASEKAFANIPENGKPTMIIFRTIKARGIPWLEDTVKSHYGFIPDDKIEEAIAGCRAFCEKTKKGE